MPIVTDFSTLFTTVHYVKYTAQTTASQGTSDIQVTLIGAAQIPLSTTSNIDVTTKVTTGFHTYYKLQGFNPITQQYENWHSMDSPLLIPPSGNALQNVGIIGSWIDR